MSIFEPITQCGCGKADCYFCNQRNLSPWIAPGLPQDDVTPEDVLHIVCRLTGADPDVLKSKSRKRNYVIPRQTYCFAARSMTRATMQEIGDIIGRDHSTVLYSCNEVKYKIESKDKKMTEMYNRIKHILLITPQKIE